MKRMSSHDISDLFTTARPLRGAAFMLRGYGGGLEESQLAVVVPKKQVAKAHDRNLLKRRVRSAVREILAYKSAEKYAILVTVSRRAQEYSYQQIMAELSELIERIKAKH